MFFTYLLTYSYKLEKRGIFIIFSHLNCTIVSDTIFLFIFSISSQGCKLGKEHLRFQLIFAFWKIIPKNNIFWLSFYTGQDNFILLCRKFSTKKARYFHRHAWLVFFKIAKNLIFCLYFFDLLFINCKSNIYQLQDFLKNKLRRSIKGKETNRNDKNI